MRLRSVALLAALALPAALPAQKVVSYVTPLSGPAPRSFLVDYHMARARDFRHAARFDAALAALDSVLAVAPRAAGVHPMRALILAERGQPAAALAALREARAAGDTLAFAAAMQIGNGQYRTATLSRQPADFALALPTLQLADSLAPDAARRGTARVLVAATALSLASQALPAPGEAPTCARLAPTRGYVALASANLEGATGAPAAQVRGALEQLVAYTDTVSRRLGC